MSTITPDITTTGSHRSDTRRDRPTGRDPKHLSTLFEKTPPHAIEAEMGLLGAILLDPQVIGDVVLIIRGADDFHRPAHGAIYEAMVKHYDAHASLDIVQLNQRLADRDILQAVGGVQYLVELANATPSAANAVHYARLVREKAMIRQLIETAGEILHNAHTSPDDARAILENAEQQIFRIAQDSDQVRIESLHELIKQTMEYLEASEGRQLTGVATGFAELDEITSGLQKGEVIIVAARPSMGKTALTLNIAENMATAGIPVGIFSLEMGRQQLVQRLLAARSGIDGQRLRRNMLRQDDYRALMAACNDLLEAPIYIDDTPGLSLLQLRAKARRMAQKHKIGVVMIDYLQLMSSGKRAESRQIEVSEISRGVKAMARELNVPVICLSQLNRAAEQREGHKPRMSDLRESGSIEQDADVIAMLHREEYYHQSDPSWIEENTDKAGLAELIIAKQRNGPTGLIKLTWIQESMRFRDYTSAALPGGFYEPAGGRGGYVNNPGGAIPFTPGGKSGPVSNHRDGGGPAREDEYNDDLPV